jgi:hypothetical protein
MKPNRALACLLFLLSGGLPAAAQDTNAAPKPNLDPYQIILRNNAFDESRIARDYTSSRPRAPRIQTIMLTGEGVFNGEGTAWFSGTGVSDTREYHVGDTIGDFKISRITDNAVTVTNSGTNTYVITDFNPTLRREEEQPWHLTGYEAPVPAPSTNSTESASSAPPSSGGRESDILERLRKKRLEE